MAKDRATTPRGKAGARRRAGKAAKAKAPRGERIRQLIAGLTRWTYAAGPAAAAVDGRSRFVAAAAVIFLISVLAGDRAVHRDPARVLFGVLAAAFVFGRRAQQAAFSQVEGQPGAAGGVAGNMRGGWRVTQAVAADRAARRRAPGARPARRRPRRRGRSPHRVRPLIAQEKKRVARVAGDTPIYDVIVGDGEGQVPIRKLNSHLVKLPRNLTQAQVNALEKRLAALGGTKARAAAQGPDADQGPARPACERTLRRRCARVRGGWPTRLPCPRIDRRSGSAGRAGRGPRGRGAAPG